MAGFFLAVGLLLQLHLRTEAILCLEIIHNRCCVATLVSRATYIMISCTFSVAPCESFLFFHTICMRYFRYPHVHGRHVFPSEINVSDVADGTDIRRNPSYKNFMRRLLEDMDFRCPRKVNANINMIR